MTFLEDVSTGAGLADPAPKSRTENEAELAEAVAALRKVARSPLLPEHVQSVMGGCLSEPASAFRSTTNATNCRGGLDERSLQIKREALGPR